MPYEVPEAAFGQGGVGTPLPDRNGGRFVLTAGAGAGYDRSDEPGVRRTG